MNKPSDYVYIAAWGRLMGSFTSYVRNEQRLACEKGAPLTAIYERDGHWHTADDIKSPATRQWIEAQVAEMSMRKTIMEDREHQP